MQSFDGKTCGRLEHHKTVRYIVGDTDQLTKAGRKMASVQERLVALVSTRPEVRRDVDIELALPWLRKKSELLQSLEKGQWCRK